MTKKYIHVTPHGDKWAVKREGGSRASSLHKTQKEAEQKGRQTARKIRRNSSCTTSKAKFGNATATAATPIHRRAKDE